MQQINLLNSLPKNKVPLVTAWQMAFIAFLVCALLIAWSVTSYHQNKVLKKRVTLLMLAQKNLTDQLLSFSNTTQLNNQGELREQEKLVEILNAKQMISVQKFIHYLQHIATSTPDNLWITQLTADNNTSNLTIHGEAYHVFAVLNYVNILNQSGQFAHLPFAVLTLTETDDKPPKIIFVIQMQRGQS